MCLPHALRKHWRFFRKVEIGHAGNPILPLLLVRQDMGNSPVPSEKVAGLAEKAPSLHLPVLYLADTQLQARPSLWSPLHLPSESSLFPGPPASSSEAEEKSSEKAQHESRQGWRNGRPSPEAAWGPRSPPENQQESLFIRWDGPGRRLTPPELGQRRVYSTTPPLSQAPF